MCRLFMFRAIGGLIRPDRSKKTRQKLDLCFAPGESELQRVWNQAYGEQAAKAELERNNALCTVLWRCAERPNALSIAHVGEPALQVLSHVLTQIRSAADAVGAATGQMGQDSSLAWQDCGGAVALLDAAMSLFVQLCATPQYRQLLLQHELPSVVRHAVTRLTVCAEALSVSATGVDGANDEKAAEGAESPAEPNIQQRSILSTLHGCVLLLGCLWQAGFAVVHAPDFTPLPSPPWLPDSIEELLRAPQPLGGGGPERSAVAEAGSGQQHVAQLLQLLQIAEKFYTDLPPSAPFWSLVVRLQQLTVAVLGVLLQMSPTLELTFLKSGGVRVLVHGLSLLERPSLALKVPLPARRRLLQMRLQRLGMVLQGASPREAEEWRAQWFESVRTKQSKNSLTPLTQLTQWVEAVFPQMADSDATAPAEVTFGMSVSSQRRKSFGERSQAVGSQAAGSQAAGSQAAGSQAAGSAGSSVARPALTDTEAAVSVLQASRHVVERAAAAGRGEAGLSIGQLRDWCYGMLPPLYDYTSSRPADLSMPQKAIMTADDAERAAAAASPELHLLFSFLRTVCRTCGTGAPPPLYSTRHNSSGSSSGSVLSGSGPSGSAPSGSLLSGSAPSGSAVSRVELGGRPAVSSKVAPPTEQAASAMQEGIPSTRCPRPDPDPAPIPPCAPPCLRPDPAQIASGSRSRPAGGDTLRYAGRVSLPKRMGSILTRRCGAGRAEAARACYAAAGETRQSSGKLCSW